MSANAMRAVLSIALMIPATGCSQREKESKRNHDKKQAAPKNGEPKPDAPLSTREQEEAEWLVTVWVLPSGERLRNYDGIKSIAGDKRTLIAVIDEKTGTSHGMNLLTRARNLKIMHAEAGSMTEATMRIIAGCKTLRTVEFAIGDLTDADLEILADCKTLNHLYGVHCSKRALARFRQARPDCQIDESPRIPH